MMVLMPTKSIYFSDEVLAGAQAASRADKRSLSWWVNATLEHALEEHPVPPRVVREHDEAVRERKAGKP
jgi:hypothetical protein